MANDELNQQFGQYTLLKKIGVGGMATVYRAIHNEHQKEVAIKILHEHFVDDEMAIKRLEREFKIASELKHPNIVPILAFNVAEGRPYLVMPYYDGGTLADFFNQPRELPHTVILKILEELAKGLDYAHSKGVIHRDFKLENILLGEKNKPIISDFGIARIANTTKLTATGNFVGTPHYMAPEQASADSNTISHRADLYAFSVMAYLMLTGVFPFTASDAFQLVIKHNTQEPPSPTLINDKLPRSIDGVLLKGLAKRPIERYESAGAFVADLKKAFTNVAPMTTIIDMQLLNPMGSDAGATFEALRESNRFDENAPRNITTDEQTDDVIPAVKSDDKIEKSHRRRIPVAVGVFSLIACGVFAFILYLSGDGEFFNNQGLIDADASELTEEVTAIVENTEETDLTNIIEADEDAESVSTNSGDETGNMALPVSTIRAISTVQASDTPVPPTNTPRPTNTAVPPTSVPATQVPTNIDPIVNPVSTAVDAVLPGNNNNSGGSDNGGGNNGCLLVVGC